ncbi:hypothetical protein K503DRAFT_805008 [Rhizopogon vinicolor AM-OR11-026]|uniref:Uncharacterized protein n=1 Tax=Rhizopogon vinicolor AM-OR11-026 TaxID=1314800 RepID=A0A1B7MJD8_9AGAM|nr:hypothetical protein K503DRAFT_805008 [Rhizopogon vinicolor AM-OR11-026]
MSMMVTFNVETDLDIANGSRGEITKIVLDERETGFTPTAPIVELAYPPAYILVKMNRTKAVRLAGLEKKNVLPGDSCPSVQYIPSDYRSQGQTIANSIIDIGTPPTGGLTPFNVYVALCRGRGPGNIRLLRDFGENLLMTHPCEYLWPEDERLARLDDETQKWWKEKPRLVEKLA